MTYTGFSYIPNGFKSNPTVEYCIKTTTIVCYRFPKQYHFYAGIILNAFAFRTMLGCMYVVMYMYKRSYIYQ